MKDRVSVILFFFILLCGPFAPAEELFSSRSERLHIQITAPSFLHWRVTMNASAPTTQRLVVQMRAEFKLSSGEPREVEYALHLDRDALLPYDLSWDSRWSGVSRISSRNVFDGRTATRFFKLQSGRWEKMVFPYQREIRDPISALWTIRALAPYLEDGDELDMLVVDCMSRFQRNHYLYHVYAERKYLQETFAADKDGPTKAILFEVRAETLIDEDKLTTKKAKEVRRLRLFLSADQTVRPLKALSDLGPFKDELAVQLENFVPATVPWPRPASRPLPPGLLCQNSITKRPCRGLAKLQAAPNSAAPAPHSIPPAKSP